MTFIEEVHAKRKKLADVLLDEEYSGIRSIVEELYPDRAHFIYELLQNAEDAGATEASFGLCSHCLTFEHNGRAFTESDVLGITNIGKGGKNNGQQDKIGRFGVGFKAVFAYSEIPHIWSPTFSFKITHLVLPSALAPKSDLGKKTQFEFPFNNPKKTSETAYAEIEKGLNELAETTLLFLSHLESVTWHIGQEISGEVKRLRHSENHFEVMRQVDGRVETSFHFLKFDKPVNVLEKQRVAVAFTLDFLPNVQRYDRTKPLAKQLKIVSAEPGQVAVYFPAEKETSGLRFHLHAPFVPELSRASVKETPVNQPLFERLAVLTAGSLHQVRSLGLLTGDFLSVLPNPQDSIPPRYQCVRSAIVEEMNTRPLTPTHGKSHAAAQQLLQAKASLKELLPQDDLKFLIGEGKEPLKWAIGVTQKNSNADRFLGGLAIKEWDIDKFVELLCAKGSEGRRFVPSPPRYENGPDQVFMSWLSGKPPDWHQELYSLLSDFLSNAGWQKQQLTEKLHSLQVVRLGNGNYSVGGKCFWPSDGVEHDKLMPRVDRQVYTAGKSKSQQQNARKFLEDIGVREVGEAEQIEAILNQRYTKDTLKPQKQDLKRFVAAVEKDPTNASLFNSHYIFEVANEKWATPKGVFLDVPFKDTGLHVYYETLGADATCFLLANTYQDCGIAGERLVKFAEAVGVKTRLEVTATSCSANPDWSHLSSVGGDRWTSPKNDDFTIPKLDIFLASPSLAKSKLVWQTMVLLPTYPDCLEATYQRNRSWGAHSAPSQLVHHLRTAVWVPQGQAVFVRPADASRDLLPEGFPFDPGWQWLKAIHFGIAVLKDSEEQRQRQSIATEWGFSDTESLQRAQRFATLPREEQERILVDHERRASTELPEHEPTNPERRAQRVGELAADAPERRTEERTRSVSVGLETIKQEAAQYLLQQYTNPDGEMICQVCKGPLPFKLDDGSPYFEKVEFLLHVKKRHYQNYLALCPNHAAMFQYANGSSDLIHGRLAVLTGNELAVVLAGNDNSIYFTKTHIADLRAVIQAENSNHLENGTLNLHGQKP